MRSITSSPSLRSRSRSRGYTFLELMLVMGVSALLAIYAMGEMNNKSEESLAQGAALYLKETAQAGKNYVLLNFESLANITDVVGVATDLTPTPAELASLKLLPAGFPVGAGFVPGRLTAAVTVLREDCSGIAQCNFTVLACTTTPVTLGGNFTRFDLASTMVTHQGGMGGQSLDGAGGVIRGPLLNVANPMGNVPGIVCSSARVNTAEFERFVRIKDTRDPDLQGELTVKGLVTVNNDLTATGKVKGDRFTPVGQFTLGAACDAADEGSIARRKDAAGLVVCQSSVWSAIGAGPTAKVNDDCKPDGSVATASSGEQLLCVGGKYRGMSTIVRAGTPNAACSNVGTTAIDTANSNETLICRLNPSGGTQRYMRLRDVTQHLSFVTAYEVAHDSVIDRPDCAGAKDTVPVSIVQLIPKTFSSPDGGVDIRVLETPPKKWTVVMRDGKKNPKDPNEVGKPLAGNSVAIAQVFCYYP